MQDLLSQLSTPLAIALIIAGILALVGVVFLARRRRRQAPPDETVVGGVGGPIDYTSIPLDEEPQSFRERFNNLSVAGKVLAILVPILAFLVLIVLVTLLLPDAPEEVALIPTPVPVSMRFASEPAVIRIDPSQAVGLTLNTTGLDDGTELTVQMTEDGEPFMWLNPEFTTITVRRDRAEAQIPRAEESPIPVEGRLYELVVTSSDGAVNAQAPLLIPSIYVDAFYGLNVAQAATATPRPSATPEPTVEGAPTATPSVADGG
ncbi:MAG: SH3 domain-containing protein, partial [Blastochloris sp.]|nr:SH3 domain-containing protein [Blastochloris sp.]